MEKHNPDFRFLYDSSSQLYTYYKWRTLSYFFEGADLGPEYRKKPFFLTKNKQLWFPPEYFDYPR